MNAIFISFMDAIEEWEADIEGSPNEDQLDVLAEIYDTHIDRTEALYCYNAKPGQSTAPQPPETKEDEK